MTGFAGDQDAPRPPLKGTSKGGHSHLEPEDDPLTADLDAPFMEKTPLPRRVVATATLGRFRGMAVRGGGGTRPWYSNNLRETQTGES